MNIVKILGGLPPKFKEACHMDDLGYIFTNNYFPAPLKGTKEYEAVRRMVGIQIMLLFKAKLKVSRF